MVTIQRVHPSGFGLMRWAILASASVAVRSDSPVALGLFAICSGAVLFIVLYLALKWPHLLNSADDYHHTVQPLLFRRHPLSETRVPESADVVGLLPDSARSGVGVDVDAQPTSGRSRKLVSGHDGAAT
jgi:hypothetical protein